MPRLNRTAVEDSWPVRRVGGSCDEAAAVAPAYLIAVSADDAWQQRAIALLLSYGLCPVFQVDRKQGLGAKEATERAEIQSVKDLYVNPAGRGHVRDAETTYAHASAWMHASAGHSGSGSSGDSGSSGSNQIALIVEEDLEMWVHPSVFRQVLDSFARLSQERSSGGGGNSSGSGGGGGGGGGGSSPLSGLMMGGCWGLHAAFDKRQVLATLSDGTKLLRPSRACFRWWTIPSDIDTRQIPGLAIAKGYGSQVGKHCVEHWAARCVSMYALSKSGARRMLDVSLALPYGIHPADHHLNGIFAAGGRAMGDVAFAEPPVACQVRGLEGSRLCFKECPPREMRRPVRMGQPLPRELGVAACAELRRPFSAWEDAISLESIAASANASSFHAAAATKQALPPPPLPPQPSSASSRDQLTPQASGSEYAALLRSRPSCEAPSEDLLPWARRQPSATDPIVLNVAAEDSPLFLGGATERAFEQREAGRRHVGPVFFRSRIRPVKVAVARVPGTEASSHRGGTSRLAIRSAPRCRAKQASIFVPIWKAASTTMLLSVLPSLYGQGAVLGPHAKLDMEEEARRVVRAHGSTHRRYHFREGPLSISSLPPAEVLFTVVRDPLARFVSGFRPFDKELPLCDGAPCNATLRQLDEHARMLEEGPPHWLTQPAYGYGGVRPLSAPPLTAVVLFSTPPILLPGPPASPPTSAPAHPKLSRRSRISSPPSLGALAVPDLLPLGHRRGTGRRAAQLHTCLPPRSPEHARPCRACGRGGRRHRLRPRGGGGERSARTHSRAAERRFEPREVRGRPRHRGSGDGLPRVPHLPPRL